MLVVKFAFAAAVVLASTAACAEVPALAASRQAFVLENRCAVTERLMFLSSRPDNKKRERFLIIQPKHDLIGYFVQCLFNGATTEMLCEAASGFYSAKAGQPRKWQLSSDALDRLAVYGFERDSAAGNHRQIFKLNARPISHVTDMMLGALHDAYGVRIETPLEFKAPLADKFGFSPSCKPNS